MKEEGAMPGNPESRKDLSVALLKFGVSHFSLLTLFLSSSLEGLSVSVHYFWCTLLFQLRNLSCIIRLIFRYKT